MSISGKLQTLLAAGLLLAVAAPAAPRAEPVLPVSEVLRDANEDFVPDLLGKSVRVQGWLTSRPREFKSGNAGIVYAHFQDDSGGLVLVSRREGAFRQVAEGDRVAVRGRVAQARGMEEIEVESIELIHSDSVPKPRDVWSTDLRGERFAGQLVRMEGDIVASTNAAGVPTFTIRDTRGEVPIFVPDEFLAWRNGQLNFALWKGGSAEVIGIAGQSTTNNPANSGYLLIPRTPEDISFAPPPPPPPSRMPLYISLGTALFLGLVAIYLADRRRAAERRTHEVSKLLHELKRSEAEVRKQATFAQLNPNPIVEIFADGNVTYWNAAARQVADTLGCESVTDLLPMDFREVVADSLNTRRARQRCEVKIRNRTIAWSFFPIVEITSVHAYGQDITDHLSLEGQLRQAQKIESVGQLAAGVAHDFNNLLAVIQGYTTLTLMRSDLPEKVSEPLNEILVAAERASNLTRQLLTFSRKQQLEPRTLDLNDLIANLTKMLRRLIGEDVRLKFVRGEERAWVHADPGMMEQMIVNLAVNARDAMPEGGELSVSLANVVLNEAAAAARFEAKPGDYACVTVTDTGCGMDEATLKRIFEPFFTTKDPGKGTGLGLATVHGVVKQHGGWIEVNSQLERGTTFRVYLPLAPGGAPIPEEKLIRLPLAGGTETILLVEDDSALRKLARGVLEEYGYGVYDAGSAAEALVVWRQRREEIRLLFTDIVLPDGVNGWALADKLRRENEHLKVIYSTGFDSESVYRRFSSQPNCILLRKPYPVQSLVRTVRECLDNVPAVQAMGTNEIR